MNFIELIYKEEVLFHYTKASTAMELILPNKQLLLSQLQNTNDPLEYKDLPLIATGWGYPQLTAEEIFQVTHEIDFLRKSKYRSASFAQNHLDLNLNPSDEEFPLSELGCCKSRMWSQYGDGHKGIVLALDKEKIIEQLKSKSEEYFNCFYSKIKYKRIKSIEFPPVDINEIESCDGSTYCNEFLRIHNELLFFRKDPDYRDENEYRIIQYPKEEQNIYLDISDSLIGIIIGDRFPDGLLPSLKYFCTRLKVACRRVNWHRGEPVFFNCSAIQSSFTDTDGNIYGIPDEQD